ncbi:MULTISPECIES: outer membrane lipoprotein carrier protein LolA [Ferrimonas]|uniref:outer membrane lipoprotein carrier protein LolA n=1 Tax=Ferrimonas TaxID=44011 RepID=UPI00041D83F2|nr:MULTISPECIES: outer membrane lipoprotein carrier protein LolA [Ferrimonas]USD39006.1 outer membrane lipoprotein carrier protein LolA [Ferrimonas sp. SCSIO 43195]
MARCLILLLTALAFSCQALDLTILAQALGQPEPVRGSFSQSKTLPFLSAPMLSEGEYLIAPDHGVVWKQHTPWPQTMVISQGELVLDGERLQQPGMASMLPVMTALMRGDIDALARHFEMHASGDLDAWQLHLTPTDSLLSTLFRQIELTGEHQAIGTLTLTDSAGQPTVIRFGDRQDGPLLESELAQF